MNNINTTQGYVQGYGNEKNILEIELEDSTSEITLKVFPQVSEINRSLSYLKLQKSDLKNRITDFNKTWKGFLVRHFVELGICGGALLLPPTLVGSYLSMGKLPRDNDSAFLGGFFGIMIFSPFIPILPFLGLYKLSQFLNVSEEIKKIKDIKNDIAINEYLIQMTHVIAKFNESWSRFTEGNNQDNETIRNLFELLRMIENVWSDNDCYENFHISYLFLMEAVCQVLKEGDLVDAWEDLKQSSLQELRWERKALSPWSSLNMENPCSPDDYSKFFRVIKKDMNDSRIIVPLKMTEICKRILNQHLEDSETVLKFYD